MPVTLRMPFRYLADCIELSRSGSMRTASASGWFTYALSESFVSGASLITVAPLANLPIGSPGAHSTTGYARISVTDDVEGMIEPVDSLGKRNVSLRAVVVIGVGALAGSYRAFLYRHGVLSEPPILEIVGEGITRLTPANTPDREVDEMERERWSRSISAVGGIEAWQSMTDRTIAIVGVGRLGSRFAAELAALPMRKLILIDGDRVELHSIGENGTLSLADIGSRKTSAVSRVVSSFNSSISVLEIPLPVAMAPAADALKQADAIVCCADDESARLMCGAIASIYQTPLLLDIGSSVGFEDDGTGGTIRMVVAGDGCLLCTGGGLNDQAAAEHRLHSEEADVAFTGGRDWTRERRGSLAALNMQVAGIGLHALMNFFLRRISSTTVWSLRWTDGVFPVIHTHRGDSDRTSDCLCSVAGCGDIGMARVREWLGRGTRGNPHAHQPIL